MKIAIIGAGNGGQAMAGHFALLGHDVTLWARTPEKISLVADTREIRLSGAIVGLAKITAVTSDMAKALRGAELVMITTTADAHRELGYIMAPHLENGQVIVLNPGRTLGALEFSQTIKEKSNVAAYVAEAQSLIYACRAESPGNVRIIGVKDNVLLSAYPAVDSDHVLTLVNSVFPCFVKAKNVLVTSLENIGAIFHPPVILFNAATIERGDRFYFYNDMTPSVADFLVSLDKERLSIGRAFGLDLLPVSDWVSFAYKGIQGDNLCEKMRNNPAYNKIVSPDKLHSRLLLEDVPTGILPMTELGRLVNVDTPLLTSILHISQSLLNRDFMKSGRTLKNLSLDGCTPETFITNL